MVFWGARWSTIHIKHTDIQWRKRNRITEANKTVKPKQDMEECKVYRGYCSTQTLNPITTKTTSNMLGVTLRGSFSDPWLCSLVYCFPWWFSSIFHSREQGARPDLTPPKWVNLWSRRPSPKGILIGKAAHLQEAHQHQFCVSELTLERANSC